MIDGQGLGIAFCLTLGLNHRSGPTRRTAPRRALLQLFADRFAKEVGLATASRRLIRICALLSLKHKTVSFVGIETTKAVCAVAIVLENGSFKNIIILQIVRLGTTWGSNADDTTKANHKKMCVREFGAAGYRPFGDERFDVIVI